MKYKILKTVIGIIVILAIGFGVYWYTQNPPVKDYLGVEVMTPVLTQDQETQISERITETRGMINSELEKEEYDEKYVAGLYAQLGTDYLMLGDANSAYQAYIAGLEIDPGYEHLYTRLFNFYLMVEEYRAARTAIEDAIEIAPANQNYYVWHMALLEEHFNARPSAIQDEIDTAIENVDNPVDIHVFYAGYLERNGDIAGAILQWEMAAQQLPDNAEIYQTEIQRLQNLAN